MHVIAATIKILPALGRGIIRQIKVPYETIWLDVDKKALDIGNYLCIYPLSLLQALPLTSSKPKVGNDSGYSSADEGAYRRTPIPSHADGCTTTPPTHAETNAQTMNATNIPRHAHGCHQACVGSSSANIPRDGRDRDAEEAHHGQATGEPLPLGLPGAGHPDSPGPTGALRRSRVTITAASIPGAASSARPWAAASAPEAHSGTGLT